MAFWISLEKDLERLSESSFVQSLKFSTKEVCYFNILFLFVDQMDWIRFVWIFYWWFLILKSERLRKSDVDDGVISQNWLLFQYVVEDTELWASWNFQPNLISFRSVIVKTPSSHFDDFQALFIRFSIFFIVRNQFQKYHKSLFSFTYVTIVNIKSTPVSIVSVIFISDLQFSHTLPSYYQTNKIWQSKGDRL